MGPLFFNSPASGRVSFFFYLINWIASISNLNIVDLRQKSHQQIAVFIAIFKCAIPAAQNHSVSLRFRKESAAAAAKLLQIMKNRFALGWAPGRPKAKFIKAVSGGLGFPWVSQRIRCKARKNWKTSLLDPFFSTARQSSDLRSQPRKNHSVSLTLRKEFAATTAKLLKNMKNRFALGSAPGRPKAEFIKAVSGGLGFPWVSQGVRCKAHKNLKDPLLVVCFSTARPPAGSVSFY